MTARVIRLEKVTKYGDVLKGRHMPCVAKFGDEACPDRLKSTVLKRMTSIWNQCGMTVRLFNFPVGIGGGGGSRKEGSLGGGK